MMTPITVPDLRVVVVALALFIGGFLLCLPIYKGHLKALLHSKLGMKILMWIPIFFVFLFIVNTSSRIQILLLVVLLICVFVEWLHIIKRKGNIFVADVFIVLLVVSLNYSVYLGITLPFYFPLLLTMIWFATVLSDVMAFFLGTYIGLHKLPARLNNHKSWEGVLGQLIGAYLGVWLVRACITSVLPLSLWLPIGIGCVLGDLANSYTKRQLGIKDWGSALPGHGGFIDRLSSLAGSVALTYWFLSYTGLR